MRLNVKRNGQRPLPQLAAKLNFSSHWKIIRAELAQTETQLIQQAEFFDPSVKGYVEYAVESHGKRLRPALCLLCGGATGGLRDCHHHLATTIELVHLATLAHDDILDGALARRAKPTCHAKWGPELAVLLGDCLFAHALKLGARLPGKETSKKIADAAVEVCSGEIMQTQRRFDLQLSVADYFRIISMKTAALFRVATELASSMNHAPEACTQACRAYGQEFGVAYQIYDDCLDWFGAEQTAGKTLGTDLAKGKLTLPLIHVLQQARNAERDTITGLILQKDESSRRALAAKIVHYGGHLFAARKARECLDRAQRGLKSLPKTPHQSALKNIAETLKQHMGKSFGQI
ncbi:MAG: polyprenyl synthetase family protein [bacterium]